MTLTEIQALSRYYATGDDVDLNFDDADVLRQSNVNYRKMIAMAIKAVGDWNMNGRATATSNIAAGTREIAMPTTFLVLKAVEVLYPSSAQNYKKATQISQNTLAPRGKDDYVSQRPEYDLYGSTLELFVSAKTADIEAVTNGVKIYYEDEIDALVSAANETILPEFANDLLCKMNAKDYCMVNDYQRYAMLKTEIGRAPTLNSPATGDIATFLNFLSSRSKDKRASIRPRKEDYGQMGALHRGGRRSADWS